jgi:hypothetical protein
MADEFERMRKEATVACSQILILARRKQENTLFRMAIALPEIQTGLLHNINQKCYVPDG